MKIHLHSGTGAFIRRTIGFRSEIVEDAEEQEPFSVTGGTVLPVQQEGIAGSSDAPPSATRKARR